MTGRLLRTWLALSVWLAAASASPQTYTWVDRHGSVHMTDDLSEIPADRRRAASTPRDIQVVHEEPAAPKPSASPSHFGPRPRYGRPASSRRRGASPPASAEASRSAAREEYWREEFSKLNQGLAQVDTCRAAIPANCSRTTCVRRADYDYEGGTSCSSGWAIPGACATALKTPGRTVYISWGSSRSLENFGCEPLRNAVDEAESAWRGRLDDLEARAAREGVPQNWRFD